MGLGEKYLAMQRASVGTKPGMPNFPYDQFPEIPRPIIPAGESNTSDARFLLMLNMVAPEDLVDDQEYGDIYEDVRKDADALDMVPAYPAAAKEGQSKIRGWGSMVPVCPRRTTRRRSRWCRAGVCQIHRCAGRTGWAESFRWTLVRRAVYHRDYTERGQPDDVSAQLHICAAV